jgi:hypothetical protein
MIKFIKYLKKALEPKSLESHEHQVVGDSKLKDLARFWDLNAEAVNIVCARGLYDWISEKDFTREELRAFKEGLAVLPEFMSNCNSHLENKVKEEQQKSIFKM